MQNTHPIRVTLPHNVLAMVKAKVASGEYATDSEEIRAGLRTLQARDVAVEHWLLDEVAKSHDEFVSDPGIGIPGNQIMVRLRAAQRARQNALYTAQTTSSSLTA